MDDMDNLIEAARCLGLVQARKSFGQYGPDDAASECGLHASISERSARLRAEVESLTDALTRNGFRRCDIAACNCGSWHYEGGYRQRFNEFVEALSEAGHPLSNENGNTPLRALGELIAEVEALRAEVERLQARAQAEPVEIVPPAWRGALRKLTFMARTSGGTLGPDEGLQTACAEAEALLSKPYNYPPAAEVQQAEPVALIESLQRRYGLSFLGSETAMRHFARDWVFLTTPQEPADEVQRLRDALDRIESETQEVSIQQIARNALEGGE